MNSTDTNTPQDFTPPRHWIGAEELEASYWADAQTRERRGQEFYDKPVETISLIEKMDTKGIARRDFLTIMGASMAMASFACARRPVHKIIPYVVKPDEVTPGVANWYASTASDTGEGVLIKVREGRPIKLEGNPDHPLSRGALSARTQATLLDLYDPDRLQAPRGGTWAEADAAISAALKKAGKVRILSAPIRGESTRRLVNEFLAAFPGGALVEYDPLHLDEIADGQAECYGNRVMPRYRFDKAEMVLSLGADFLGVWPNSTEHMADWAKGRKLSGADAAHAKMSKLVAFESTMSLTGANADERTPIRPGDELKVALAIAHELIVSLKVTRFAGDGSVTAALAGYRPETVAAEIGLVGGVDKIKSAAKALWDARGRGLVVAGSLQAKSRDALALQIAVNLLNSALDNEGATIDGTVAADTRPAQSFSGIEKLVSEMNSGAIEVLILHRVNPAYAAPGTLKFEAALRKVPLVVFVGDRDDETGAMAQYALPVHHALESWGDAHPRQGLYSLQQPAIAPIHSTRSFEDGLLTWIKSGALKANGLAARVAVAPADQNTWHDYLKANWRETVYAGAGTLGSFDQFWEGVLREGVYLANYAPANGAARSSARTFRTGAVTSLPRYRQSTEGVMLALYAKASMYDGRWANNAWMQEMPDPISTITWDNYLNISSDLAQQYSLATHDMVELTVGMTSIKVPVHVQPGMHARSVSMAVGYGRRAAGKVGSGVGIDVFPMATFESGRAVYSGLPVAKIRKTGARYQLAETQWHHATENRPIINDLTLAEFRKNPGQSNHTDPHLRMEEVPTIWPKHEYKGYRWGMAIDLTSCTGCGACVVGCQAENNIPAVGRANVRISREMHWIRIDRYYSGSAENPSVVFQPMLCQHCENAPCETVCPVLATVHNDEGLNEQIYNRCVGTRYCQNNCPYKVRRFNFFDHWKSYEGTMNLVWNPDVTVRSRGIMEKCNFCVQRIREAKDHSKELGTSIKDGDLKTACQQTCPTEAIVFGDINDPTSRVSKLQKDQMAFRVLEVLNVKPVVSYLSKVRNKAGGAAHADQGHG